jgi:hypothetical protein
MSTSTIRIVPEVGSSTPSIHNVMVVVFPAPLGPRQADDLHCCRRSTRNGQSFGATVSRLNLTQVGDAPETLRRKTFQFQTRNGLSHLLAWLTVKLIRKPCVLVRTAAQLSIDLQRGSSIGSPSALAKALGARVGFPGHLRRGFFRPLAASWQ